MSRCQREGRRFESGHPLTAPSMISREAFKTALAVSVARETSSVPELWTPENPMLGHCAVASVVAQDYFGGDILRATLKGTDFEYLRSHYWNRLPDGEIDFTKAQFQGRAPILIGLERSREQILEREQDLRRYNLLSAAVEIALSRS